MSEQTLQCPCGRIITNPQEFKLLFLKMEMKEIDILCPNDSCYLRELGYIKFDIKDGAPVFKEAMFYPPFVTWNNSRLGSEVSMKLMREHLRTIVTRIVDWKRIKENIEKFKLT
ncbi:hypothetical protein KEJ27_00800 [Candidatus Bathyarchaeota archaeon]|nr:hypothetical protein [Candidatus Bathyarchaeota archaeon]MBS7614000.1 hypothetical protein [Candidatus Bathyarchaeota archaeon]MBS7617053.1 hypothetical protein [Candidatus Bathyarchaeota archaeon]